MPDLLYRRASGRWVFKAQYTNPLLVKKYGRKIEKSLGTTDVHEAQALAADLIREHKLRLMEGQNLRERRIRVTGFAWRHQLGERTEDDGTRVLATEQTVLWIKDGAIVREERNEQLLVGTSKFDRALLEQDDTKPAPSPFSGVDTELLKDWVRERTPSKYILREAEKAFQLFKTTTDGKLFKDAFRPDAVQLVDALKKTGMKNGSINKHLSHMRSICTLAMLNGKLKHNPFSRVTLDVSEDALAREPFSDDQMKLIRDNLHTFPLEQQKLWILLACTGMRLSEPWDATSEASENGIRKIRVGSKTETSDRWIPLPSPFLQRFPERVDGPMFQDNAKNLGKQLLKSVRALGINSPSLVIHSLRHRAKDRLRALDCPDKTQHWILGHEVITAADRYGKGPAMSVLKPWIDRIGY